MKVFNKKIPFHLWIVILISLSLPLLIDYFFHAKTPIAIYLLYLIPIFIFIFYFSLKEAILGTILVNQVHIIWGGIYYTILFEDVNVMTRIYNHLGLTLVSFTFVYIGGRLFKELKESEQRYRNVVEISPELIFIHQDNKIKYANPEAIKIMGLGKDTDFINKSIHDFLHPSYIEKAKSRGKDVYNDQRGDQFVEYKVFKQDGEIAILELLGTKISYNGKPAIMVVGREVTEQREVLDRLEEREERYRSLFYYHPDAIITVDLDGNFVSVSPESITVSGYSPEELVNESFIPLIIPEDLEHVMDSFNKALAGEPQSYECRITNKFGNVVYIEVTNIPIKVKGEVVGAYGIIKDVTEKKKMLDKIEFLAYHDGLTGLPNRYMFNEHLKQALLRCDQEKKKLAVLFLDLDRFRQINDTLGHDLGDLLLQQVSERLIACVRNEDIVARQGGDEFILLLENIEKSEVEQIAQEILDKLLDPFFLNEEEAYSTPSIGISIYPEDGRNETELIKNADTAMYNAKNKGKNTYSFYNYITEKSGLSKLTLENNLRRALLNNELTVNFQPKVNLATGEIIGTEALVRWEHPRYGYIPPSEFIPVAEETGLIISLGKQVLEKACYQNKKWHDQGFTNLMVAVNVSVLQFHKGNIIETVTQILEETKLPPNYLVLEITESVLQDIEESKCIIERLGEIGVKVAVDDFGTGYSSLTVLNRLPIHYLKIDKSFIDDLNTNGKSLVKTIIEMGRNLKFELIAEGIENQKQLDYLKQNGCQYGQGYYFSKPMAANYIEEILKGNLNT
jgi:diguanylate cyclase (GGDEF)-like protein/PAS domain S-box-containing protein